MMLRGFHLPTMDSIYRPTMRRTEAEGWSNRHVLEHLCQSEATDREQRSIGRLMAESGLSEGKTLGNPDEAPLPAKIRRQLPALLEGGFVSRSTNILAFGLPRRGKTHFLAALGRELILRDSMRVLFHPTFKLVGHALTNRSYLRGTMTITDYVAAFHAKLHSHKAEIVERWNTRILPQGLHARGRAGAADYLARYGKGISAKKVSALALMAESENAADMAAAFWEEAYRLETGKFEPFGGGSSAKAANPVNVPTARKPKTVVLAGIPDEMQPGKIATMQPGDAPLPQSSYVLDPEYIGQPKRDGNRDVVFGTPTGVAHQSRSYLVTPTFSTEFDEAAKKAAAEIGTFILDGEKLFLSANGKEHRTAAQAATENANLGQPTVRPVTKYSAFKALYFRGSLLEHTEIERVKAGAIVVAAIRRQGVGDVVLEATPTAYTTFEKTSLVSRQKAEGREGEVWTKRNCTYTGGKGHKTDTVRTKYLIEVEVIITGIEKSTAEGRTVAAFVVRDLSGKPVGRVGTGFDDATARKLAARHRANPGSVRIPVIAQGWTENGRLWHARLGGGRETGRQ